MHTVRRLVGLLVAVVLVGTTGAWAQLPSNELEGTWRMVSQELVYPDSVVDQSGSWGANVKILNSTHFAWGRETEDVESVLAGGGRYEYHPERGVCVEHIQCHSDPSVNGGTLRFEARVEGGLVPHRREGGRQAARGVEAGRSKTGPGRASKRHDGRRGNGRTGNCPSVRKGRAGR
jgi:hypothetical protein